MTAMALELALVFGLIWLVAAAAVAGDAYERGMSWTFWFAIVVILGIIGVALYLIELRREARHSESSTDGTASS